MQFNGGGGTWILQDSMTVTSTMTLTGGTLDTSANNQEILLQGGWVSNGGSFNARKSTVTLNGSNAQIINSAGTVFEVLWDSNAAANGVTFASSFTATLTSASHGWSNGMIIRRLAVALALEVW